MSLIPFIGPIVELAKEWVQGRREIKSKQQDIDNAIQQKKLDAIAAAQSAEVAITIAQINTSGWKSNWFTVLFSIPFCMAFIPATADWVSAGLVVIAGYPDWLKAFFGASVSSAFGMHVVDKAWSWWHA